MKKLIIVLALVLPAYGATLSVCSSGCDFPTAQAALDASKNGDTIVLRSGQNHGSLTIPGGRHDLTIKSSLIDSYPRGYRITRNNPALARLTTISAGDFSGWVSLTPGSPDLVSNPGAVVQPHGFKVGDKVVVGGTAYTPYACAALNQPPYTDGGCDASRVGFLNIRTDTKFTNGSKIYFRGRTLPPPLTADTPYYVVNFTRGGSVANADKFQVSLTPGGDPVEIPQFDPFGQDFLIEARALPQGIGDAMYVVKVPTPTTLQLSTTVDGPPTIWTDSPYSYNGGGLSYGFTVTRIAPVYNIVFDGIELFPTTDYGVYYPFYISRDAGNFDGENHDIHILRCWIHGADDQETFPMTTLVIGGRDIEIGWNIFEGAYSTGNDTQGIGFTSTKNVSIHDNEIKGSTEGILSGGNIPWFAWQTNTTGIYVYRNYLWKPLKYYVGISAQNIGPTQFQLVSRYAGADCASVAASPNLGTRCFAYESEESDPSHAVVSRFEWTATAANSRFSASGSAGQKGDIYLMDGVIHMDHNFSGTVTCPDGIQCAHVATPAFPARSTRLSQAVIGSGGTFDGTFYQENRNVWSKNLLESKYGDNWLIEGNVFHRQSNCDGGSTCQDPAIQFTVAGTGSGGGEPVNYSVSSSNSIIRNNIFRHLSAGIVGVGKTFAFNAGGTGLIWEAAGFGQNRDNRVENNLFIDLGSTEYSPYFGGVIVRHQNTESWIVQHNTAVDVRIGFLADGDKSSIYRSNVVTPYRSACPEGSCSSPSATSHIGVQNSPGPGPLPYFGGTGAGNWFGALGSHNVDATSRFDNNIIMNRNGFYYGVNRGTHYPATTWLIQADDPGRDPKTLFKKWQERDNSVPPNGLSYRAGDYRLAVGIASLYPAYDDRSPGAEIDEIEALTGRNGIDVERGWPTFAERTARTISIGSTSAALSYLRNGSSCTIKVWANASYRGLPTVNINDGTADSLDGLAVVTLSGLSAGTAYYGKRWCGDEGDVFSFLTLTTTPEVSIQLAAPGAAATCIVEYGSTPALGSVSASVPVSGGRCSVAVPASAIYWRHGYRSAAGTVVGRGDIQRRGL